jgi:hypothetical protein
MKKTATLLLCLFAVLTGKSQSYIPFPDSNAIWTERHANSESSVDIYTYGLKNGDTVFNGISYHKLYFSNDSVLDANEFWAGLRQDVAAKKVYLYKPGSPEKLVFDFSLQTGDIFNGNLQVSLVDSIFLGGVYRKRFSFTMTTSGIPMSGQWVEGIGNTDMGGPFGYPAMQPTCDCGSSTLCVGQNGQWIYHNTHHITPGCYKSMSIQDNAPVWGPVVQVYPNPLTSGTGHISLPRGHEFITLDIYNIAGSKLRSYDVSGKTNISLYRSELAAGMYYYRLTGTKANSYTGRFVVE